MITTTRLALAALLALPLAPVFAAPMQPGLWELSMTVDGDGEPRSAPMARECITQKDIDDGTKTLPRPGGACKLTNVQRTADRATYDLACTQDALQMRGRADVKFAAEAYDGKVDLVVAGREASMHVAMTLNARRVGECAK
jgi:Protein of unknown function (DUF3617)